MRLFSGHKAAPPSELLWRESIPERVVDQHNASDWVPDVDLVSIKGMRFGGMGLYFDESGIRFPEGCLPAYVESLIDRELPNRKPTMSERISIWIGAIADRGASVLRHEGPVIVATNPNFVYGHFLIEMMPRILALDAVVDPNVPILVTRSLPHWAFAALRVLAPNRSILQYDSNTETVQADEYITCTNLFSYDHSLNYAVRILIDLYKARLLTGGNGPTGVSTVGYRKVYLSRSAFQADWHAVDDELAIEAVAASCGLEIVHPQQLTFEQQVHLFSGCNLIVGEYSSAMHNSIFSPCGARVVCLNWINWYQSRICALLEQPVGYIPQMSGTFTDHTMHSAGFQSLSFDVDLVRDRLTELTAGL